MLGKVIGFELRYRFKKPLTYIFMAMMVFQAIWYAKGSFDYYVSDNIFMNAASIIYRSLAGGGMLMIIAIAVVTGTALFKDIDYKTGETFYSYPVSDKTWLAGKFLAAYIVNLSICLAYALGFSIIQYSGIGYPEQFTIVPWGHIFYGYLIFSIPNMFVLTSIAISMVVFFRNMASSYLGVFIVTMLFIMAEGTRENAMSLLLVHLIEPYCYTWVFDLMDKMTVPMKNYGYIHLDSVYWLNRAIWFSISALLIFFSFKKFSFKYFIIKPVNKKQISNDNSEIVTKNELNWSGNKRFSLSENIKKMFRLSFLELKNTIRPVGFSIICGMLALMFFGYNYMWNADYYIGTDTLPITSMMTFTRLPNGIFMFIILAVFAGELLYKERTVSFWQITDTLPVPTWVTLLSKYIAMVGVSLIFAFLLFIPGVLAQSVQGFFDFEWHLYFTDFFTYHQGFLDFLFVVALAFFVGSITANRFGAHIMTVGILFFIIVFEDIGIIERLRFAFPYAPGNSNYSEMNGYGVFGDAGIWYALMWSVLSLFFIVAGIWFWNRGSLRTVKKRFSLKNPQLNTIGKFSALILLIGFFLLQNHIKVNEEATGNFKTDAQQELEDAKYEKLFKYIENSNQPYVCGLELTIDINPNIRKADYNFDMMLTNRGTTSIDTLYLSLKDFVTLNNLQLENTKIKATWNNKEHHQSAYGIIRPIEIGDTVHLIGTCSLQYVGFSSQDAQEALVYNGSFLCEDIVPHIGYNSDKELEKNRVRGEQGLNKLDSRMDAISDTNSLKNDAIYPQALWQKTTIRVHTCKEQVPYASGSYKGEQSINNKQYAVYETTSNAAMNWYVGSARYESMNKLLNNGTNLQIFYDRRHSYNLDHFIESVNDGISFLEQNLGDYPYLNLTISEIPKYNEDDFYTAPNLIAVSEKLCWTADGKRKKDLSYIYYALCREIFKQWVKQNLHVADVQGAQMLLTAIPEAYALAFIEEKFGKETLQIYLDKKHERYSKGRGNEANIEPPLICADNPDYLEENKGATELLNVINVLGIEKFSALFTDWLAIKTNQNLVFIDFYNELKIAYPENKKDELISAFEIVVE